MAQMGKSGNSYELIFSTELQLNIDSTVTAIVATIQLPERCYTSDKILYVKIRDKAGKRAGYFFGSDTFIINPNPSNGETSNFSYGNPFAPKLYSCDENGKSIVYQANSGVFGGTIKAQGALLIYGRYNATMTRTINGTMAIDVYLLDWPGNISPFAA